MDTEKARDFVYQHGALWERALFAHLFEDGPRDRVIACLRIHQNEDGGWAHGVEKDVQSPHSNAVSAEYALGVMVEFGLGEAVGGTAGWAEASQAEDGTFELGERFHAYPHGPWWQAANRWPPSAIVGRLAQLGAATPKLLERTKAWAAASKPSPGTWPVAGLTHEDLDALDGESWRYALYHYGEYAAVDPSWRELVRAKALALAEEDPGPSGPLSFGWAPRFTLVELPAGLRERHVEAVAAAQQEDGGWPDPHDLLQWRPVRTIWALGRLREAGRL
jgi:hypothetical protein